ncbi:MAG: thiamine phosphate synthase [Propionibacteriaceae bacterium]|nr:thiamine phosphate synthase [Micropruina sp.]
MTALMGLDTRIRASRLYLITDGRTRTRDLAGFLDKAYGAGVDLIEIRDPFLKGIEYVAAVTGARQIGMKHAQGLVVAYNDLDAAKETGADVVLIGQAAGATPAEAKAAVSPFAVIGQSVHTPAQVDAALADPAVGFLMVGPVFTSVRGDSGTQGGIALVHYAAEKAPVGDSKPWFAVGGINADNVDEVLAAGARRVAVAKALTAAPDVAEAAAELAERLTEAWNDDPALADKIVIAPPMIKLPDAPTFPGEFTIAHDEQTHD